jgi:hypothetical protein
MVTGGARSRRGRWRRGKGLTKLQKAAKNCGKAAPPDKAPHCDEPDKLLLSALKYWEVERDLIEERLRPLLRSADILEEIFLAVGSPEIANGFRCLRSAAIERLARFVCKNLGSCGTVSEGVAPKAKSKRNSSRRRVMAARRARRVQERVAPAGKSVACQIVDIGGPAGGFEVMMELLRHLPPKKEMTFVVGHPTVVTPRNNVAPRDAR